MSRIKLSFVIPVYNVELYLNQCINSILKQNSTEVEIVIVDDGSDDKSPKICESLAKSHQSIKLIHQSNSGHSAARNVGLSMCQGDYIAFVDADDFIGDGTVKEIIEWINNNNADICFINGFKYFSDDNIQPIDILPKRDEIKGKNSPDVLKKISYCEKFPGSACTKLFSRKFLIENSLSFPEDVMHGEDLTFVVNSFALANSFDYLNTSYYFYRQDRAGSVTTFMDGCLFDDLSKFIVRSVETGSRYPHRCDSIYSFAAYEYTILLYIYSVLSKDNRKTAMKFLKNYRWILDFGYSKKIRFSKLCIKLLGIRITSSLMITYMHIRQ